MKKSNKWEQADRWYGEQPMPQREVQAPRPMGGGKLFGIILAALLVFLVVGYLAFSLMHFYLAP
jgi:hypothetical protein